jgi:hypothetical protein
MVYENYKHLIGHIDVRILSDMVRYSEELSDEQRDKLNAKIDEFVKTHETK